MKLIHNWRVVLQKAWSIRLLILAGLLSGAEVALPIIGDVFPIPRGIFAALSFVATCGGLIARLSVQKSITGAPSNE